MPPQSAPIWRPNDATNTQPPYVNFSLLKRTFLLCSALVSFHILIINMIGYESLWITTSTTVTAPMPDQLHMHLLKRRQLNGSLGDELPEFENGSSILNHTSDRTIMNQFFEDNSTDAPDYDPINDTETTRSISDTIYDLYEDSEGSRNGNIDQESDLIKAIILNLTNQEAAEEALRRKRLEFTSKPSTLPLCPENPPDLIGSMSQADLWTKQLKESDVLRNHPDILRGGHWKPDHCMARHKVAIIIPFRDRQSHLTLLLDYLIPMLQRQLIDFRFIVTEQYGRDQFNKGRIMNAAFVLAEKLGVQCVIFHDVDMYPQDDRNLYYCPENPRHLGAYVDEFDYKLLYYQLAGGILAISMDHYRKVNGYSNAYWGWGGEDDDMGFRFMANNLPIERPPLAYGKYTMIKHTKRHSEKRWVLYKFLHTAKLRWPHDGVNKTEWRIVKYMVEPLYHHLYIDVGFTPEEWKK